jgi:alpha-tubulin suppressor-like RCC1 family protein
VWCWGRNNHGQLGTPTIDASTEIPGEVALPGEAAILVGGRDHLCAALDEGADVVCWGANNAGQIGDGTDVDAFEPVPLARPLPAPVVSMSGRFDTTCALLESEDLWCWGGTQGSIIGIATEPETVLSTPTRVDVIDELPEAVIELGIGQYHVCARAASGRVWCWGRDNAEQLGPQAPPVGKQAAEVDLVCPDA